jgi:hypothetical protein
VEPLNSFVQAQFLKFWIPGWDIAVDKFMVRFTGRSHDIITILSKLIPTRYKGWAVA